MGVTQQLSARDAQQRPDSDGGQSSGSGGLSTEYDPFIQQYMTDEWDADADTIDEILTGMIAVGQLL